MIEIAKNPSLVEEIVKLNRAAFDGTERAPDGIVQDIVSYAKIFAKYDLCKHLKGVALVTTRMSQPYIWSIAVRQDCRGQGVGGRLLEEVVDYAKRISAVEVSLMVNVDNANAQRVYLKHGFRVAAFVPHYYVTGSGLMMRRKI